MRLSYHLARRLDGDALHARLYCSGGRVGCSWVGFGFASVPGRMIGSTVVIGVRDETGIGASPPLRKYVLSSQSPSGVTPMATSFQTLEDAELSDVDEAGGEVGLLAAFMLRLSTAEGMNPVDLSRAFLVYAHGNHETVSYHGVVNRNHLVIDLVHQPRMTGSPKSLLKETAGTFLVRLKITVADGSADFHYVAFDAARALIIDNAPYVKFPEIRDEDLRDNRSAIRPFFHLFPNATDIRIASVLKGMNIG